MTMLAYKGTVKKSEFVKELLNHQKADNFIRGTYWNEGKGCAVGCSLESVSKVKGIIIDHKDHKSYETHLGIPEWLARLEDILFEGMNIKKSKSWPVAFAKAIRVGADLDKIKTPFIILILKHTLKSMDNVEYDGNAFPYVKIAIEQSKAAVTQMIKAQKFGDQLLISTARSATAYSAADSAYSAAFSAAGATAASARSAAASAAFSARSAAFSAADSAAYSAAASADSAAAYDYYAAELLKLLRKA